ncbi:MAG: hypothetical protein FJ279_31840 [Planctomycetes bacterium]|nr:hypothetical protein [Planctomycetota bacterium]
MPAIVTVLDEDEPMAESPGWREGERFQRAVLNCLVAVVFVFALGECFLALSATELWEFLGRATQRVTARVFMNPQIRRHLAEVRRNEQARIARLRAESLEKAIERLLEGDGYAWGLRPGGPCCGYDGSDVPVVLSGRRFSRLESLVRELPKEERVAAAERAFAKTFEAYRGTFDGASPNMRSAACRYPLPVCRCGVSAAVLLFARLGELAEVCQRIRDVRAFVQPFHEVQFAKIRSRNPQISQAQWAGGVRQSWDVWFLQPDVEANAIVIAVAEAVRAAGPMATVPHGKRDQEILALSKKLGDLLREFPRREVAIYPWDVPLPADDRLRIVGTDVPFEDEGREILLLYRGVEPNVVERMLDLVSAYLDGQRKDTYSQGARAGMMLTLEMVVRPF